MGKFPAVNQFGPIAAMRADDWSRAGALCAKRKRFKFIAKYQRETSSEATPLVICESDASCPDNAVSFLCGTENRRNRISYGKRLVSGVNDGPRDLR